MAIKVVPHGWATAAKMASEMELCTTLQHRHVVKAHFHFTVETRTQTIVVSAAFAAQHLCWCVAFWSVFQVYASTWV